MDRPPKGSAITRSHPWSQEETGDPAAKAASSPFSSSMLFLFDPTNCWACPAIWGRISIRHWGGRGACQHKQSRTACCQWEMSAFIATFFHVDRLWANLPKSNKKFSDVVAPLITFSKRVVSPSLTSDCWQVGFGNISKGRWFSGLIYKQVWHHLCSESYWHVRIV